MKPVCITAPKTPIHTKVSLPSSKSISNRLLILQSIQPELQLSRLSDADDTVLMQQALNANEKTIDLKNAGTCVRFLAAYFAASGKHKIITGNERMKSRPVKPLVDALTKMDANIQYLEQEGFLPIEIFPSSLKGGHLVLDASQSSQFVSALLLISPLLKEELTLQLSHNIASYPYIDTTIQVLKQCGIMVHNHGHTLVVPAAQQIIPTQISVQPDWSAASYWYEIAALSQSCEMMIDDLSPQSIQGDAIIAQWMKTYFGVETIFNAEGAILAKTSRQNTLDPVALNLQNHPDLTPALAATACGNELHALLSGLQTLAFKESNRLSVLCNELSKTGAHVTQLNAAELEIKPSTIYHQKQLVMQTHNDHRMAMAFAPLALCCDSIKLDDGLCVEKSYPAFWDDLKHAGFDITF